MHNKYLSVLYLSFVIELHILSNAVSEDSVRVIPESAVREVGEKVTFTCKAGDRAENRFQWFKDSMLLEDEIRPNLTISVTSASNGGDYLCQVSNLAGRDNIDTANLYVGPMIKSAPTNITATIDTTVMFTCAAYGFPLPTYSWEREDSGNFTDIVGAISQNLTFNSVQFSNAGGYRCSATVFFPKGSSISMKSVVSATAILTRK